MNYLKDLQELEGVKVLVRVDFNVPIKEGKIVDDFRIRKILPTIEYLQSKKAKIILMSHLETKEDPSLAVVALHLEKMGMKVRFVKDYKNALGEIEKMEPGSIILLENLRLHEGEKKNDKKFAQELASLGDLYVNEAFAVSHRAHASVSAITSYIPSYAGLLFEQEVKHLSTAFAAPHPFLFILGGAKFETKMPLVEKFIVSADKVFIGGALANDFFKAAGKDIGTSLVSEGDFELSRFINNPKLMLPTDSVWKDTSIMDVGEKSIELLGQEIKKAKYILWNGPVGAYELGYTEPTHEIARMIAEATSGGAQTILGGGDTLAALAELQIEDRFTFVSTGGGAMLEFLAKGTLAGIVALENSKA